jgi:exosortase/archaeosortase family protein
MHSFPIIGKFKKRRKSMNFDVTRLNDRRLGILARLLPIFSLITPLVILYYLDSESFEMMWKGRTFLIFFVWLIALETILNWEKLERRKIGKTRPLRTILFAVSLVLPTIYVVAANYGGINSALQDLAVKNNIYSESVQWVPLFTEYLMLLVLFTLTILLEYGVPRLTEFSISIGFQGAIGLIYTIDTLYPFGRFTPFQMLVPTTATLAAKFLNLMGYATLMFPLNDSIHGSMTQLVILNTPPGKNPAAFAIAWPCSGVESLIIYTVTILLFLKSMPISWKQKIAYFTIGAAITYLINIFRIVMIYLLALDYGRDATEVTEFHNYYGQLYSITWIISYPLILIGSQILWQKIQSSKMRRKDFADVGKITKASESQSSQPSPV